MVLGPPHTLLAKLLALLPSLLILAVLVRFDHGPASPAIFCSSARVRASLKHWTKGVINEPGNATTIMHPLMFTFPPLAFGGLLHSPTSRSGRQLLRG
jgi:hypothetical protein